MINTFGINGDQTIDKNVICNKKKLRICIKNCVILIAYIDTFVQKVWEIAFLSSCVLIKKKLQSKRPTKRLPV